MKLQVHRSEGPPSHDLAFEAEMLHRAAAGRCSVLACSWPGPVVVLGYGQPPTDVDLDWCRSQRIPVLRRLSGGTGVIHRGDLGLGLAMPADHPWARGIVGLYDHFLSALEPALRALGGPVERLAEPGRAGRVRSPICFEDQLADTLVVGGRKAVGCSQTRRKGGVLVHAAVLLGLDAGLYARVFDVDEARIERGLTAAVTGVVWSDVATEVVRRLAEGLGLEIEESPRPRPPSEQLASYGQERWAPVADDGMR